MAHRGFSCPNCHTWFEGEGNHPRCPLCGTRASPRDLLDDREQHQPSPEQTATSWEFESPDFGRPPDYEVPAGDAPDYEAPEAEASDYEVPRQITWPENQEQGSGYGEVRHYEASQDDDSPSRESKAPPTPRPTGQSESDWGDRIGPIIGVVIFIVIIASRACRALAGE